jgi:predicted nucleic acid-binding protein
MAGFVVLDAGPLVAFIDRGDHYHNWAVGQVQSMTDAELITCEAVISETYFLSRQSPIGVATLLAYLDEGIARVEFNLAVNLSPVTTLMRKYRDIPRSLADACLVRMSELHDRARVFTLDSDFKRYRRHSRQSIPLIAPA